MVYILRIEKEEGRAEHRIYKTESGARKALFKFQQDEDIHKVRLFREVTQQEQLSLFEATRTNDIYDF